MKHQVRKRLKVAEAEGTGIAPGPGAVLERAGKGRGTPFNVQGSPGDERQRLPVDGYGRVWRWTQSFANSARDDKESRSFKP